MDGDPRVMTEPEFVALQILSNKHDSHLPLTDGEKRKGQILGGKYYWEQLTGKSWMYNLLMGGK